MKNPSKVRAWPRVFLSLLVLILFQAVGPACRDSKVTRIRLKLEDVPPQTRMAPTRPTAVATAVPPACPAAGVVPLQRSQLGTGHHNVVLSWNPSSPSTNPDDNAVGYCLYRSKTKKAARKNPTCRHCEQVNSIPVVGTACVDDLVQDDTTYYYVATAISGRGRLSSSSNEIRAVIPDSKQSAGFASTASYPLCRSQASSN